LVNLSCPATPTQQNAHSVTTPNLTAPHVRLATLEAERNSWDTQLQTAGRNLLTAQSQLDQTVRERGLLAASLREQEVLVADLNRKLLKAQGAIRVVCRIRPVSAMELHQDLEEVERNVCNERDVQIACLGRNGGGDDVSMRRFHFTQVLDGEPWDDDLLNDVWPFEITRSSIWRNVLVACYGQSGSGKTFTNERLLAGALGRVFSLYDGGSSQGWNYELRACFIEIDGCQAFDLLDDYSEVDLDGPLTPPKVLLTSLEQAQALFDQARHTRRTERKSIKAAESSRISHAVIRLSLHSQHRNGRSSRHADISLVDLARSEGDVKPLHKGTIAINNDVAQFRQVLLAMAGGAPHIPFRSSKVSFMRSLYLHERVISVTSTHSSLVSSNQC